MLNTISPGDPRQVADESANVRSVLDDIRADPRWLVPKGSRISEVLQQAHSQLDLPMLSPSPAMFLRLRQAVADAGMHHVFGGLGAESFGSTSSIRCASCARGSATTTAVLTAAAESGRP